MRDHKSNSKTNKEDKSSNPSHVNSVKNPTKSKLPSLRHTQIQSFASETDTASINSLPGFRTHLKMKKFSKTCTCSTLLLLATNYCQAQAVESDSVYATGSNFFILNSSLTIITLMQVLTVSQQIFENERVITL